VDLPDTLTGPAIRSLLADLLAGSAGGSRTRWHTLIGEVEVLPIALHVSGNWRVAPSGTAEQLDAIGKAVAVLKAERPYATNWLTSLAT
jgi:hypothetical protein